jgi:hypothetical protein
LDIEDPEIFLSRVEEFFTSIRNLE